MSARRAAQTDTRLVPMTREQRDWLDSKRMPSYHSAVTLVAAWDAAPADPAEAIDNAIFDAEDAADIAHLVLVALGLPAGLPHTTPTTNTP